MSNNQPYLPSFFLNTALSTPSKPSLSHFPDAPPPSNSLYDAPPATSLYSFTPNRSIDAMSMSASSPKPSVHYAVLFGFPSANEGLLLLRQLGIEQHQYQFSESGMWIWIRLEDEIAAQRLLSKNGTVQNGWILGAVNGDVIERQVGREREIGTPAFTPNGWDKRFGVESTPMANVSLQGYGSHMQQNAHIYDATPTAGFASNGRMNQSAYEQNKEIDVKLSGVNQTLLRMDRENEKPKYNSNFVFAQPQPIVKVKQDNKFIEKENGGILSKALDFMFGW